MATKHGVNAIIYLGATTAVAINEVHNIQLDVSTDFAEDSSMGDSWKTYLPGLSDFNFSFDKWFDSGSGNGALLAAVIARTLQKMYFYPDRADATVYVSCTGYLGGGGFAAGIGDIIDQSYEFRSTSQPSYTHP